MLLLIIFNTILFANNVGHLLITQIVTQPDNAESISIYNPTNQNINLENYYICDDNEYYLIQENIINSSGISGLLLNSLISILALKKQ